MNPALVATSTDELGSVAAAAVADALSHSRSVAFSGGTTPAATLRALAGHTEIDWPAIDVFQVDERVAPEGHPDRNLTMLESMLLDRVPVHGVHPMLVD
ncbi:MAG: 6-phosphogluconolactonase, partial [Acidimicrobiia bacterium]|nr:6-phosphogluconolactonase [Acidimicrobiia bacterium]